MIITTWLKLSGATAHEGQGLMCTSQYTLDAKVHEQISRSGGQSEARPPVLKSSSKPGTHLSTHCTVSPKSSREVAGRTLTATKVFSQNWGRNEPKPTVTVLKATDNNRRVQSSPLRL
ncbi:hypothetical protein TNCV_2109921 [Trichonephila clavipes]|nr:hypothetical protein TNCV_2109921 [Trichonephila clavipes]